MLTTEVFALAAIYLMRASSSESASIKLLLFEHLRAYRLPSFSTNNSTLLIPVSLYIFNRELISVSSTFSEGNHSRSVSDKFNIACQKVSPCAYFERSSVRAMFVCKLSTLQNTYFFNPLERAKTTTDINKITDILIDNAYSKDKSASDATFWNNGAKNILSLIIQAVKQNPDSKKRNLQQVRRFLLLYGQTDEEKKIDKMESKIVDRLYHDQNAMDELASFTNTENKVRNNFITTAKRLVRTSGQACDQNHQGRPKANRH